MNLKERIKHHKIPESMNEASIGISEILMNTYVKETETKDREDLKIAYYLLSKAIDIIHQITKD